MNRLILIGNGFDLAHGLKTGYNDFIIWYLKKCFKSAEESGSYDDGLINIRGLSSWSIAQGKVQSVEDFIESYIEKEDLARFFYIQD